jgi:AraC family transcriptional regulator
MIGLSKWAPAVRQIRKEVPMNLKTVERPAQAAIGLQIRTKAMSPEIPALWPKFVARIDEIPNPAEPRVSYGVMRLDGGALEYTAAVSVRSGERIPAGMVAVSLPAGTYAQFSYPLSGLARGFCEINDELLPASNYQPVHAPFFERYNEAFDPRNPHSAVEIYIPVRPRA